MDSPTCPVSKDGKASAAVQDRIKALRKELNVDANGPYCRQLSEADLSSFNRREMDSLDIQFALLQVIWLVRVDLH